VRAWRATPGEKHLTRDTRFAQSGGRKRAGPESEHEVPIIRGDDRRRLVPETIVKVLTILIDEQGEWPSHVRVELRSIRARMCRLYQIDNPESRASETGVAQAVAEEDGIPQED